jgi:DNA polymerase III alpha subunit
MMLLNTVDINNIISNRPYKNFEDFYNKIGNKMNEKKLEHLICSDAFHKFGDIDIILTEYNSLKNKTNNNQMDFFDCFDDIVSSSPILTIE